MLPYIRFHELELFVESTWSALYPPTYDPPPAPFKCKDATLVVVPTAMRENAALVKVEVAVVLVATNASATTLPTTESLA